MKKTNESDKTKAIVDINLINKRLREIRKHYGLSQKQVAEALNIKQPSYARLEIEGHGISDDTIIMICLFYDVSANYLLGFIDDMVPINRNEWKPITLNNINLKSIAKKGIKEKSEKAKNEPVAEEIETLREEVADLKKIVESIKK